MKNAYRYVALSLAALSLAGLISPARAQSVDIPPPHSFTNSPDGAYPLAGLVADPQGNFYGTTNEGGQYGYGTVFQLTPPKSGKTEWTTKVLLSFCPGGFACTDGAYPAAGLLWSQGALYGTASEGGTPDSCDLKGCGTVFQLTPPKPGAKDQDWQYTLLYSFAGGNDGGSPYAGLIADAHGALYGTTYARGAYGYGTVFQLTPPKKPGQAWTETVLYSFGGPNNDGIYPLAGVIFGANGNLYGTTSAGGLPYSKGTVFQLTPPKKPGQAWTETVLYSFCPEANCFDGANPLAGLIADAQGNLYGTTSSGGAGTQNGTVFQLTQPQPGAKDQDWKYNVLYRFGIVFGDGTNPYGGLIADAKGNLYGTTNGGGSYSRCPANGCGTIFQLTPPTKPTKPGQEWTETVLYSFVGFTDGAYPASGLIADAKGNLYGTTSEGGTGCGLDGCGTVFRFQLIQ